MIVELVVITRAVVAVVVVAIVVLMVVAVVVVVAVAAVARCCMYPSVVLGTVLEASLVIIDLLLRGWRLIVVVRVLVQYVMLVYSTVQYEYYE